jgi:hypothetical protein
MNQPSKPPPSDLVQVGVSAHSRQVLERMRDNGHIIDLIDGYRLGIAVAIAFGREPRASSNNERRTTFAIGSVDPDNAIRQTISEMYPEARMWPSRAAEDLAEQGLKVIGQSFEGEDLSFADLSDRVRTANDATA